MIKQIRDYFRLQIRNTDSELRENPSAFYDQDIGETILDRSYQIEINNISNTNRDTQFSDQLEVTINIFGFGGRSEIEKYDELLEKAICIRDLSTNIKNFSNYGYITNIIGNSLNAEQMPSDENAFKININFTLSYAYSRG
jgi:hypothetical protein